MMLGDGLVGVVAQEAGSIFLFLVPESGRFGILPVSKSANFKLDNGPHRSLKSQKDAVAVQDQ